MERNNTGKRYIRDRKPWEYSPPWWLYVYAAAVLYIIFG